MESHLPADPLIARRSRVAAAAPSPAVRREARAGLYVHVPFCAQRCSYCDFSTGALSSHAVRRYLAAMACEVAMRAPTASGLEFSSVFFGGGTPSALSARAFSELWTLLTGAFAIAPGAEITLEANPESVRPVLLDAWRAAGVNRLSMGAQSFDSAELALLGRIHDAARPGAAFALARRHGFHRLSLDLMFGYPGHTEPRWRETIARALELEPEHVSAYCFIPERGTELGDAALSGVAPLPAPEEQAAAYACVTDTLAAAGLACYETSNFARPGAEARHNLVYWLVRPYVALGPSAHGFVGGERYGNHYAFSRWATALERGQSPEAEREPHDATARATEALMLGARLGCGIERTDHEPRAWESLMTRYGIAFDSAARDGRLERTPEGFRIPARHRFVADDIVAWIEARARRAPVDRPAALSLTCSPCPSPHSPVA
jgi:putative oxygen-independent coproporphyrinogen III oxidase